MAQRRKLLVIDDAPRRDRDFIRTLHCRSPSSSLTAMEWEIETILQDHVSAPDDQLFGEKLINVLR
jgi:hypothetical protein